MAATQLDKNRTTNQNATRKYSRRCARSDRDALSRPSTARALAEKKCGELLGSCRSCRLVWSACELVRAVNANVPECRGNLQPRVSPIRRYGAGRYRVRFNRLLVFRDAAFQPASLTVEFESFIVSAVWDGERFVRFQAEEEISRTRGYQPIASTARGPVSRVG